MQHRLTPILALAFVLAALPAAARDWADVLARARGQTVYLNAWGGDAQINDYLAWAAGRVKQRLGVDLVQVKLADAGEAVGRVLAEKTAGRAEGGTVDLIWINGENFAAMKEQGLLYGPFARDLPNFALVDTVGKPTTLVDFTVPTEGFESPWGTTQFVFIADSAVVPEPPRDASTLLARIGADPGRFTYPAPPDFVGTTFVKHLALELAADPALLARPVESLPEKEAASVLGPVWAWLDAARPNLWRNGEAYPQSGPALHRLMNDGEVDFSMAFNPAEASRYVLAGDLPETTRTFVFTRGTIGNSHFLAIPFNAAHKEAAMAVADFLLSPEAQARKQDPLVWGDGTVLALDRLTPADRRRFDRLKPGPATLPPEALLPVRPEPHPSWMERIETEWRRRYAAG